MNYSHDFSSIQPIYSHDSLSHDSGFKTGSSSSNCADHEELLKVLTELEDVKQQSMNAQNTISELEQQISVLAQENNCLQTRLVQTNTLDEMKSVHEELSFLEEVRQGQMCTRCLKNFDDRMTENTSFIGTEGDDDDRSLMELLNETATHSIPPVYRSSVTIKVNSILANFLGFIPFGESFI
jgi:predicted nuclease with TOPRIM domain